MRTFIVTPLIIHGVKLHAVGNGLIIEKYCDSRDDAVEHCRRLNSKKDDTNEPANRQDT